MLMAGCYKRPDHTEGHEACTSPYSSTTSTMWVAELRTAKR